MLFVLLISVLAQPLPSALSRAAQEADAVVEFELPLLTTEQPGRRWARALPQAKLTQVVASRSPTDPPETLTLPPYEVIRSCLGRTNHRLTLKVLAFVSGSPPRATPLPHAAFGLGLESTPGYAELKAALAASFEWRDERMRAVGADQLWRSQRTALGSENGYLRHLAAEFLWAHGAGEVVDAVWGAAGSEAREKNEALAKVAPDCKATGSR